MGGFVSRLALGRCAGTPERLDVIPAQFHVVATRRPKLERLMHDGMMVQMPPPQRLIEGGLPTEAFVSHVQVFAVHQPL